MPARETLYPRRIVISVNDDLDARLARTAGKHGVGKATIARESIERGLPLVQDARRKAAAKAGTQGGK
ncbi:MAG: hypothetical protein OXH76_20840 [Boseongicola sp.]|nr:hypothetical protein [Boseongicola sp.]